MAGAMTALELDALALEFVDNLALTIENASPELSELAAELAPAWYPHANTLAQNAIEHGMNLFQGAGIVSAFSVMTRWSLNERDVQRFFDGEETPYLRKVRRGKAEKIAALEDPTLDEVVAILGPFKTGAFADNIANPKTSTRVTIDTIMCQAGGIEQAILNRKGVYERLEQAIRDMAAAYGWEHANEFQAFIWILYRGEAW